MSQSKNTSLILARAPSDRVSSGPATRLVIAHEYEGDPSLPWLAEVEPFETLAFLGRVDVSSALGAYPHVAAVKGLELGPGAGGSVPWRSLVALDRLIVDGDLYEQLGEAGDCPIRSLDFWGYPFPDLTLLSRFPRLTALQVRAGRRLKSLNGISGLIQLETLDVFATKALHDFEAMPPGVVGAGFYGCRGMSDLGFASALRNLQELWLDDCGDIDSLAPLDRLPTLRKLSLLGDTNIADGAVQDTVSKLGLKAVTLVSRRHYDD